MVLYGSFPAFRTGINGTLSCCAISIPNKNPRLSTPTTASISVLRYASVSAMVISLHKTGFSKIGVMSLNKIPGFGKSGTSRTVALTRSWILIQVLHNEPVSHRFRDEGCKFSSGLQGFEMVRVEAGNLRCFFPHRTNNMDVFVIPLNSIG